MAGWLIVLLQIAAMFLVILLGWVVRRRAYLTAETTGALSRFVVDFTIPSLVLTQMLSTVNSASLRADWYVPLLGIVIFLLGQLIGMATTPFFARRDQRPTAIFLVATGNWIYLPLPIVSALYHADGVRVVLLYNIGATLALWTLGVWTLRGGRPDMKSLRALGTNPGLIATVAGIVLALLIPAARTLSTMDAGSAGGGSPVTLIAYVVYHAVDLVGSLTIPLSLVVTGAQLGGLNLADHRPSRTLTGVLLARLILTPAVALALIWCAALAGFTLPPVPLMVGFIIAAMPPAISCSIFTDRFGGDTSLAARAIFAGTLLSIATVPVLFYLIHTIMQMA